MTRDRIPGTLDARALALLAGHVSDDDYRQRADRNRPHRAQIRAEALRLHGEGLTARDIAQALRVGEDVVQTWIAEARK